MEDDNDYAVVFHVTGGLIDAVTEYCDTRGPFGVDHHAAAGIELRVTPSIWPFWRRVTASTVEFSGSRLRNAAGHPERIG